jgi:hypothetical protein
VAAGYTLIDATGKSVITGSVEPYADLNLKALIDAGALPGPHMDVTGPYLEGAGGSSIQMHQLTDPAETTRMVNFWADQGVTSFKGYMNISRADLGAAIDAANARRPARYVQPRRAQ